jgi:hypothetical protein
LLVRSEGDQTLTVPSSIPPAIKPKGWAADLVDIEDHEIDEKREVVLAVPRHLGVGNFLLGDEGSDGVVLVSEVALSETGLAVRLRS